MGSKLRMKSRWTRRTVCGSQEPEFVSLSRASLTCSELAMYYTRNIIGQTCSVSNAGRVLSVFKFRPPSLDQGQVAVTRREQNNNAVTSRCSTKLCRNVLVGFVLSRTHSSLAASGPAATRFARSMPCGVVKAPQVLKCKLIVFILMASYSKTACSCMHNDSKLSFAGHKFR